MEGPCPKQEKILAQNWKSDPMNSPKAFGELIISKSNNKKCIQSRHLQIFSKLHICLSSSKTFCLKKNKIVDINPQLLGKPIEKTTQRNFDQFNAHEKR